MTVVEPVDPEVEGDAERDQCCPPLIPKPPIPNCVVQFNYERWLIRFPEFDEPDPDAIPGAIGAGSKGLFGPVSKEQAQELFYDATLYLDNSCNSPVCDASVGGERERLLFLLTAHIAYLTGPHGTRNVGRLTSKSVGPMSVSYGLEGLAGNAAWYSESPYGLAYWDATAKYRTFRYRVPVVIRPINGFWRGLRR